MENTVNAQSPDPLVTAVEYVLSQLAVGHTKVSILSKMQEAGWDSELLTQVFADSRVTAAVSLQVATQPIVTSSSTQPDVIDWLNDLAHLVRSKFTAIFLVGVLPLVLYSVLTNLLISELIDASSLAQIEGLQQDLSALPVLLASIFPILKQMLLIFGAVAIGSIIVGVYSTALVVLVLASHAIDYVQILKKGLSYLPNLILFNLLLFAIALGSFPLFFIPGFLVTFWATFSPFLIILENQSAWGSLHKSRAYFRGQSGYLFIRLVMLGIISWMISAGIEFVIGVFESQVTVPTIVLNIIASFLSAATTIILTAGVFLLYSYTSQARALPARIVPTTWQTIWYGFYAGLGTLLFGSLILITLGLFRIVPLHYVPFGSALAPYVLMTDPLINDAYLLPEFDEEQNSMDFTDPTYEEYDFLMPEDSYTGPMDL